MKTGCLPPDRIRLHELYTNQKQTIKQCAEYFGMSTTWLKKFLNEYNIPIRSRLDYPGSNLGKKFTKEHKEALRKAKIGNKNWLDKKTSKHFNYKRFETCCGNCGKVLHLKQPRKVANVNFCSIKCNGIWKSKNLVGKNHPRYNSVEVHCDWCGKVLVRKKAHVKRSKLKHFFCNYKHNGLWKSENLREEKIYNFAGGYDNRNYGSNWRQQKKLALERDKYTCQECGKTKEQARKNPDVHHKKPFRHFGLKNYVQANDLNNLISLCASCHSIEEGNGNKKDLIKLPKKLDNYMIR